ncbi:hypothetical protein [Ruegeria lacuscaerulensis]|uniref:hypothetical protein n=1 Tax=Ruegeria lacuscaerulensis TaxID=55218 RepID=UPI001F2DFA3C|nr:hypothetical protein [Ruegeria lacuscaerulensis]
MATLVVNSRILTVHFLGEYNLICGAQPVDLRMILSSLVAPGDCGRWNVRPYFLSIVFSNPMACLSKCDFVPLRNHNFETPD